MKASIEQIKELKQEIKKAIKKQKGTFTADRIRLHDISEKNYHVCCNYIGAIMRELKEEHIIKAVGLERTKLTNNYNVIWRKC